MAGARPTVRQRRLARILRRLREDNDLTIDQVAEKLMLSRSTISRIENAQVAARFPDVHHLLDVYKITGTQRDELLQLARESRQQPWWQEYRDLPSVHVAGFEAEAASIWQYSALVIPGLLQTEAYAREVLSANRLDANSDVLERRLQLRMGRQELLIGRRAPQLWVVLDEAVLRRGVGGPQVMQPQLERLIDASALPNVTIQLLPFKAGAHAGMDGEFTILRFHDPTDPDVVFLESSAGDTYIETADVIHRYDSIFENLQAAALDPATSAEVLVNTAAEWTSQE